MTYTIKTLPQEQEQQIQPGTQVGGFTVKSMPGQDKPLFSQDYSGKSSIPSLGKVAGIGAGIGAGLGAMKVGGKLFEKVGKGIYGLTLPPVQQEAEAIQSYKAGTSNIKPKTTIETLLEQPIIQKGGRTLGSKLGGIGTRSMVGAQSEAAASNLFKSKINPIMKQADDIGIKFDYKSLIKRAQDNIAKSAKYSETQKAQIIDDIAEIGSQYRGSTSLKNLDLEKQAIASKLPQKYQTMVKLPQEAKVAQKELASIFRKTVHDTIKNKFGVNSAKIYQDYANLKLVSKIGPKALTEAGRKGGAGGFLSWAGEELATPITTTAGKLTYKVGKGLQKLPDMTANLLNDIGKKGLSKLKSLGVKGLLKENALSVIGEEASVNAVAKANNISKEEAKARLDEGTKQLFQLPGEGIKFVLDKVLGLPQSKESKEFWKSIK